MWGALAVSQVLRFKYSSFLSEMACLVARHFAFADSAHLVICGMKPGSRPETFPQFTRFHRLRQTPALRQLVREHVVTAKDLVYPIFVEEDADDYSDIPTMPGIQRIPEKYLEKEVKALWHEGITAIIMFGVSHHKDETGSDCLLADGLLSRMISRAKHAAPDMIVIADCCFCEYTSHGHCGVLRDGQLDNDATIKLLASQAVNAAKAGADIIAPSAMMDGQVRAIRERLDNAGYTLTPIMAYSSKLASAFYGPFRAAAGSQLKGDRKMYQIDPVNGREALRESFADDAEGADILMVKPGIAYLDVISRLRQQTCTPIAAYQVSGEYAMIKFAAKAGAVDEASAVRETLGAFKRAGADIIISYFAREFVRGNF